MAQPFFPSSRGASVDSGAPVRDDRKVLALARALALLVGVLLAGCAARRQSTQPAPDHATIVRGEPTGAGRAVLAQEPPEACAEPAPVPERDAAIDALLGGRALEALAMLETRMRAQPWDLAASYLRAATQARAEQSNDEAAAELEELRVTALQAPPRDAPAPGGSSVAKGIAPVFRLRELSVARNLVTDGEQWLARFGPPLYADPAHPPPHVASSFRGVALSQLFGHADHVVAAYGNWLVCSAPGRVPRAYSLALTADPQPLEVEAAQLVGDALLVQLAYNGYAKLSGGRNGYVAAFDATTGRVRWVSPPLTANRARFVVIGGSVVSGYGFTAEPDFLYQLDLASGALLQKLPLASGPDVLSVRGDRLHVRTYDRDYVFAIETGAEQAPVLAAEKAALSVAKLAAPAVHAPSTACWLRAALSAVDARDPGGLARSLRGLSTDGALAPSLRFVLEVALQYLPLLRAQLALDLWSKPPVVIAAPPWQRALLLPLAQASAGKPPKLVRTSVREADPVRETSNARGPFLIAPAENGRLPEGAPNVPTHYGLSALSAIIASDGRTLLVYAGRYLAIARDQALEQIFDLDALRHPPKSDPTWKDFAEQDVSFAQLDGEVLYVCNGGGSYAREVYGKKGFVTAIELATGALRWRSDPLRCNATFGLAGEHLVTGYGFTAEPDYLFVLRKADGQTVARAKLATGPDVITVEGDRVHVETYGHSYDFELQ